MRGEVIYLYAFDVANEIVTKEVREILATKSFPFEVHTDHTYPKDVPLYQPLTIEPPVRGAQIRGQNVRLVVRVFEVGVVNLALRVPFEAASPVDLMPFHQPRLDSGKICDAWAREICGEVCDSIRPYIKHPGEPSQPEAYTVFCITDLGNQQNVEDWFRDQRRQVAGLLTETPPDRLSDSQVEESLRIRRSFTTADLTVIDWDSSLVVDLDGYVEDVLYVLELANLQLEEFHVMDRRLDRQLDEAYQDLDRRRVPFLGAPTRVLDWLRRFRVDAAKLTDEITHITKFIGDWHLARVYLGAKERFHLDQWRESVEQRLGQLDDLYQVLKAEVYERRMLWLEVAILVCFIVDLFMLFFWKR